MNKMSWGRLAAVVGLGLGFTACGGTGSPPVLGDVYVGCTDGVWDFVAQVDDPDGYADVSEAYVEVYHVAVDAENSTETLTLGGGENGEWTLSVDEADTNTPLDCLNFQDFEFDFYAADLGGNTSEGVTFTFTQ